MISINTFKRALGKNAENLTEEQIKKIYDGHYALAHLLFDMWAKKSSNTKQVVHKRNGNIVIIDMYVSPFFNILLYV